MFIKEVRVTHSLCLSLSVSLSLSLSLSLLRYSNVITELKFGDNKTQLMQYMFWDNLAQQQTDTTTCSSGDSTCHAGASPQAQLMVGNVQGYVVDPSRGT